MIDTKIQWHPGFIAAMNLELKEYRANLIFEKEYNLNTKPLEIDLLIIKKEADTRISNEIGEFFRGHNILEYKSPGSHLSIDTFFKTLAYSCLYKSYSDTTDSISADDITMSIIRESKPEGLFQYFKENSYQITNPYKGIYHIKGPFPFPSQIIATGELDKKTHTWLSALSGKLNEEDIQNLLEHTNQITGKTQREMADSVLEVSVRANRPIIEKLMGDESMCNALMEIMEPKMEEVRREGRIQGIIEALRDLKHTDSQIRAILMNQYRLTENEINNFL